MLLFSVLFTFFDFESKINRQRSHSILKTSSKTITTFKYNMDFWVFMEELGQNGLVTADGTKVLTVEEYDKFLQAVPEVKRVIFEINTITGLRYVELQRLYNNPQWYLTKHAIRLYCLTKHN